MTGQPQHIPIFVGSTYEDLIPYRDAVLAALHELEIIVRGMEYFGSKPRTPVEECLATVQTCRVYIGVFAMRYGTVPDGYDKSLTHLEYEEAQKQKLPSLVYIMNEQQPILPRFVETGEGAASLCKLKDQLRKDHVVSVFTTPDDLARRILRDLPPLLKDRGFEGADDTTALDFPSEDRPSVVTSPTWDNALAAAESLLEKIESSTWQADGVIGIGRSGGIWGGWLAGNLGSLPFCVVDETYADDPDDRTIDFPHGTMILGAVRKRLGDSARILLVQGAASTTQTFQVFRKRFVRQIRSWDLKTAVLYKNPVVPTAVDFVGDATLNPWPSRFPWHVRAAYKPFLIPESQRHDPEGDEPPSA